MVTDKIVEQSLEKYELEQLIGQDALVNTYLAYDPEESRHVLITVLRSDYAENERVRERYINRANSLSQIRHPNIAIIYGSGETKDARLYTVTEHIEGFPLADRLHRLAQQQSPAHVIYALTLIRQIASGLSLAERLGYFHYELTPQHILLKNITLKTADSVVLVNLDILPMPDFPAADPGDPQQICYLSPEQQSGKEINSRSHVYSLGTILFQLLTGKPPDRKKPTWHRPLQSIGIAETPLKQLRGDLSPQTYDLIEKSLRTRPGSRYRSLSEFVAVLDKALAAEDLRIHTSNLAEPRRPRPIYLAPLLLLLICISLAAAMWWFNMGNPVIKPQSTTNNKNRSAIVAGISQAGSSPTSTAGVSDNSAIMAIESTSIVTSAPIQSTITSLPFVEIKTTDPAPVTSTPTSTSLPSLTPSNPPPTIELPTVTKIIPTHQPEYRISASSASLRRGPGTRFDVGSYLLRDEIVVIIAMAGTVDNWYVIETTDGRIGWISASVGEPIRATDLENLREAVTVPAPPPTLTPTATLTPIPTNTPITPSNGGNGDKNQGDKPKSTPTPPL